jgi:hypothetical protein
MINAILFAHNGIDHKSHMEAAAHESGSLLWIIAITLLAATAAYMLRRFLGRQSSEETEEEEE